jgi:hypothetical protein
MRFTLPLLAALASTIVAGLILLPVVNIVFDRFFHLYLFIEPPADRWKDDLIIWITIFFWFFIASGAGGFVCTLLSETKEDFSILLFLVISFIITTILSSGMIITDFEAIFLVPFFSFIGGTCTGGFLGVRYKKRKGRIKDTPPFPAGTPWQ